MKNVYVPPGIKHYEDEREESKTKETANGLPTETKATIWFIADYGLSEAISVNTVGAIHRNRRVHKSDEDPYLFVYEQAFINENQFIIFKERKPGWYAS